jgi:hypothetical protein
MNKSAQAGDAEHGALSTTDDTGLPNSKEIQEAATAVHINMPTFASLYTVHYRNQQFKPETGFSEQMAALF